MIKFTEIQDLLDRAFEPGIGFEGPFPVPYSTSFANGVQAGWRAAIARALQMINDADEPEIIGTAEAAEICGIGAHGIIAAIKRGLLDAVKIGGGGQRGVHAMLKREAERYRDERRPVGRPTNEEAMFRREAERYRDERRSAGQPKRKPKAKEDCPAPCPGCLAIVGREGKCLLDDALFGRPKKERGDDD